MKGPVAAVSLALALCAAPCSPSTAQLAPSSSMPPESDEFVGPFSSWTNVKTAYGAVGDGIADDTAAIQKGLSEVGREGHSPVLFLPSGTYRITGTLVLAFNIYVSLVGEHPESTMLVWNGPAGGTMLLVNGLAYSRVTRLTFDGTRTAAVAVEQSFDNSQSHFDTGNEYSDTRFLDVEYGIHGGFKGYGFAETSILRAQFVRNTKAGVALGNFNALDIWVWHSLFDRCNVGVTNDPGAGNYRVYDSVFRQSTTADLVMRNTGGFSARGNFSTGSKAFYVSNVPINHPATIDIQQNTIVDSVDSMSIRLGNHGPALILDNTIVSRPQVVGPVVSWRSLVGVDVVSVGNSFTAANPLAVNGRLISIDDRVVARAMVDPREPPLPPPLPNLGRPVFEVTTGADAAAIQRVIDSAVQQRGKRPIVHVPFGTYSVAQTLTIPPSDLQLVGDGMGTRLQWSGPRGGPVVRVTGPSQATIRELQVDGAKNADGIVADNIDQPGSRVSLNGVELRAGEQTNLFVNGLAHAAVQLTNFGHAYSANGTSVRIIGGRTTIFSGASSGNWLSYDVSGDATVLVRDTWYEGTAVGGVAAVHDRAAFTMQGSRVSSPAGHTPPAFSIANLTGRVTLLTTHIDDRIAASGNGSQARVLGIGVLREPRSPSYFSDTSAPPTRALLINGRQRSETQGFLSPGSVPVQDIGAIDPEFIKEMLADSRQTISPTLNALPPGASDLRMFRVWATSSRNNLLLRGSSR